MQLICCIFAEILLQSHRFSGKRKAAVFIRRFISDIIFVVFGFNGRGDLRSPAYPTILCSTIEKNSPTALVGDDALGVPLFLAR